ncbi:hypothetical protein [Marinigracilibium pacificum]|uniref:Lipocalin-like protein n=1 Tax=Marinigracilibium pacificum TaxID=2729599 RepID=A0A848J123_9BACT|nr:hypothetical protein [Marinigracilibium pacificum]NMM50493.1 hypothetical protein [Marinigracilibium pacificum]
MNFSKSLNVLIICLLVMFSGCSDEEIDKSDKWTVSYYYYKEYISDFGSTTIKYNSGTMNVTFLEDQKICSTNGSFIADYRDPFTGDMDEATIELTTIPEINKNYLIEGDDIIFGSGGAAKTFKITEKTDSTYNLEFNFETIDDSGEEIIRYVKTVDIRLIK